MKPLSEFLPEVLPSVPGCPIPLAINAVRNSVIEFLARTNLLEQTLEIDLDPSETEAAIECDGGARAVTFIVGYLNGARVTPVSPEVLADERPDWRNERGLPIQAFIRSGALVVVPRPETSCVLTATFAVSIKRNATRVEDVVLDEGLEAVAAGALGKLLILPGVPWSNPELAEFHRARAQAMTETVLIGRLKGSTNQSMRVTPRAFV